MVVPRTLYDKIVDTHVVCKLEDPGEVLLYIDRTVLNEYTSPQAFAGLRSARRTVWRPGASLAVVDHVNPTSAHRIAVVDDQDASRQIAFFTRNCREFGIELFDILDPRQGIEHIVAPEQGLILPGMVVAAGDSHTTTYGALGALGFGIGTSDIEHYLATQTLVYTRLKTMRISVKGELPPGISAKDVVMAIIRKIGADGAAGHVVEFDGTTIRSMSVEARMTICNMIVEGGARGAVIAPDEKVFAYVQNRPRSPHGSAWESAVRAWQGLCSDDDARFDREVEISAADVEPMVSWGTSPDQAIPIGGHVPDPANETDPTKQADVVRALDYMGLKPGTPVSQIKIDRAFIGSCTNSRIEDLREAASVLAGRKIATGVRGMVVPGSTAVRNQAEQEGLDAVFMKAGFEWRQSGCSLCLAMNNDVVQPGERCASSTNRNFEGRQGRGARTHLMSPAMVAAAAVAGHLIDSRLMKSTQK